MDGPSSLTPSSEGDPLVSWPLRKLQELKLRASSEYRVYEDALVEKVKGGLLIAGENPELVIGVSAAAGLLLLRGPRRFLFRHTLGRFQSLEAKLAKADDGLKELNRSVGKLNSDATKLLKVVDIGEETLLRGETKIKNTGKEIQRLIRSIYKIESNAADIMDGLHTIPSRNALQLRSEVASLAADLKEKRIELEERIEHVAELGIKV